MTEVNGNGRRKPTAENLDRVAVNMRLAEISSLLEDEKWKMAELACMKYAAAVVQAEEAVLADDDPLRSEGYKYVQVTRYNWSDILDEYNYPPIDGMPGALAIDSGMLPGSKKRSGAPEFLVHADAPKKGSQE